MTEINQIDNIRKKYPDFSGDKNPFFGKHHTEKYKKQKSEAMSGSKNPMYGVPSPMKGKHPWNYGFTKESDERVKQYAESGAISKKGKTPWNKDKPWSEEVKEKLRVPHPTMCGENNHNYGKPPHHGKKKFLHSTPLQGNVFMFEWEHLYATYLDSIGELYLYEPDYFEMTIEGHGTTYTPDFLLPVQNKFIEIKGYWRGNGKLKSDKFREMWSHCFYYEVLMKQDLQKLGIKL